MQKSDFPFDFLDATFQVLKISHLAIAICTLTAQDISDFLSRDPEITYAALFCALRLWLCPCCTRTGLGGELELDGDDTRYSCSDISLLGVDIGDGLAQGAVRKSSS